jgi:hypothetical protein
MRLDKTSALVKIDRTKKSPWLNSWRKNVSDDIYPDRDGL